MRRPRPPTPSSLLAPGDRVVVRRIERPGTVVSAMRHDVYSVRVDGEGMASIYNRSELDKAS